MKVENMDRICKFPDLVLENLEEKNVQIHPRLQMFLDLVDIVVVAFSIMSMTWT
jgi:hypothetical protein